MTSFTSMLDQNPPATDDLDDPALLSVLSQYFQVESLEECITVYQALLQEWSNASSVNVNKLKSRHDPEILQRLFENKLNEQLKSLQKAEYDSLHRFYRLTPLTDEIKAAIERRVIDVHMKFLVIKGMEKLSSQDKALKSLWHPDKKRLFSEGMNFLETTLGASHCFRLVGECVERINRPSNNQAANDVEEDASGSEDSSSDHSYEEYVNTIFERAVNAPTYSERFFYKSLAATIINLRDYSADIKDERLKVAAVLASLGTSIFCISFFAAELSFGIVLAKLIGISANELQHSPDSFWQHVAKNGKSVEKWMFYLTASLPAIISSGNISIARYTTSGISNVINLVSGENEQADHVENQFHSLPIKLIISHLEKYIVLQSRQWVAGYREGAGKGILMRLAIDKINKIASTEAALADKLNRIESVLAATHAQPVIGNSGQHAVLSLTQANEELKRARLSLVSIEKQRYYMAYHGMLLPLEKYVQTYNEQWIASWRKNAGTAKCISKAIHSLTTYHLRDDMVTSTKLTKMSEALSLLRRELQDKRPDRRAMQAISDALAAALPNQRPAQGAARHA